MAIHIIGAKNDEEAGEKVLPQIDADLPHPNGAPANKLVLEDERILELLGHDNAIVRTFAIEQVASRDDDRLLSAVAERVNDEDPMVAMEAIGLLERREEKSAVETMKARFADAKGDLAAALASALGQLAPETLLEAVKARGRMDGEAYAATATALAIIGSPEVVEFLDKALNRAGALSPERRGALYGSALLSGDRALAGRVLGYAIDDSKKDEPENASFPTRAALCVLTGVPIPYSRREAGLELLDMARETLEHDVVPLLDDEGRAALEDAMKLKQPGAILAALAPVLEIEASSAEEDGELGTMPRRRKGLLAALVERAEPIGKLDVQAAGLFVATATKAASIVVAGGGDESKSQGLVALEKALEGSHDAATLAGMSEAELTALFESKPPREMRRLLSVIARETFLRGRTVDRLLGAAILAGHGEGLLDAAAESDDPAVHAAVIRSIGDKREQGEAAVLEVLQRTPLEERVTPLALACAEELRTERLGLVVGRRFLDLRAIARSSAARALLRVGDPRLLPVLESRAFEDEPEEVAWAVLSLVSGREVDEKLEAALARTMRGRDRRPDAPEVRLPLRCERCTEELWYGFERVFLDVEARDELGDPAFVGEVVCKACGAEDRLKPTAEGSQILTQHMMQFLQAAQSGQMDAPPLVTPAQTNINGKKAGLSEAMRVLEQDIAASPSAIRPRLHRARLRLLLKRKGVEEDLEAVLEADAQAVEAMAMRATQKMRDGDHDGAVEWASRALAKVRKEGDDVRLYDTDDRGALAENLEEYLVELEAIGTKMPEDLDLSAARHRREEKLREMRLEYEAQRAAAERPAPRPQDSAAPPSDAAFRAAGRNDPCPCGSGKKFKKCHGARS